MHRDENKSEIKTKMNKNYFDINYNDIISIENLLEAWKIFRRGKSNKLDVQEFEFNLMDNILSLHTDLHSVIY